MVAQRIFVSRDGTHYLYDYTRIVYPEGVEERSSDETIRYLGECSTLGVYYIHDTLINRKDGSLRWAFRLRTVDGRLNYPLEIQPDLLPRLKFTSNESYLVLAFGLDQVRTEFCVYRLTSLELWIRCSFSFREISALALDGDLLYLLVGSTLLAWRLCSTLNRFVYLQKLIVSPTLIDLVVNPENHQMITLDRLGQLQLSSSTGWQLIEPSADVSPGYFGSLSYSLSSQLIVTWATSPSENRYLIGPWPTTSSQIDEPREEEPREEELNGET